MMGSTENKPRLNFKFARTLRGLYLCVKWITIYLECDTRTAVRLNVTIAQHDVGAHIDHWLSQIWSLDTWYLLSSGNSKPHKGSVN